MDMKIIRTGACSNSPKNKFVEDFTKALLESDRGFIEEFSGENFEFPSGFLSTEKECTIEFIFAISHGKFGSLLCRVEEGDKIYHLSFRYLFSNIKASKMQKVFITKSFT